MVTAVPEPSEALIDAVAEVIQAEFACSIRENVHDGELYCAKHRHLWLRTGGHGHCQDAHIAARAAVAAMVEHLGLVEEKRTLDDGWNGWMVTPSYRIHGGGIASNISRPNTVQRRLVSRWETQP